MALSLTAVAIITVLFDMVDDVVLGGHYDPPAGVFTVVLALIGVLFAPDAAKFLARKNGKNGDGPKTY